MKTCTKCKEQKELTEFHKDSSKKDGYRYECKMCKREQLRASYHKHKLTRKLKNK